MSSSAELGYNAPIDDNEPPEQPVAIDDIALPTDDSAYEEQPDGSVIVHTDDESEEPGDTAFDANLAESMDESDLGRLALELIEAVEKDKESRKRRDELYAEGLRSTGLSEEKASGADFDGSSDVVHPMIVEGCIDFAARAMKEIFPPAGPCKTKIIGEADEAKLDRADRKRQYMNWQLTTQCPEYRSEMEQLLSQVPLGGSQYLKVWRSAAKKRTMVEFVPIDHLYLPFACSGLMTAQRVTHHLRLTKQQFEARVASGAYRDVPVGDVSTMLDGKTDAEEASWSIEGADDAQIYDEDGLRSLYEIQADWTLDDDSSADGVAPYVITIDVQSRRVMAIRRNWDEDDELRQKLAWIVEFPFIPWRGAYAIGLPHIVGGLGAAATGALRALLDSAHINNAPSALKLKGSRLNGQNVQVAIGEIAEIEGPAGVTDIRDLVMAFPFNPPSTVLFELLKFVVDAGKSVVGTAEESIADATSQMPVGTALALIEQGSITYSAVHARLHAAQAQVLAIFHRLNAKYLSDQETVEELGSLIVSREDFAGPVDVIPVSDPNIFSEAQRYAQLQAVLQLAAQFPQQYKVDVLNQRALKLLNFPEADEVLNTPQKAVRVDQAYKENSLAAQGDPILAFNGQNHLEHLQQHLQFATSPMFGGGPLVGKLAVAPLVMHCTQHLILLYEEEAKAALGAVHDVGQMMPSAALTENHALAIAMQKMAHELAPIMPLLAQAQQLAAKFNPPTQAPDPALQVGMAEIQRKTAADQADHALEVARDQRQAQVEADALALEKTQKEQAIQADLLQTHMQGIHSLIAEKMANATAALIQELKNQGVANQTLIDALVRTSQVTANTHEGEGPMPVIVDPNAQPSAPMPTAPIPQPQPGPMVSQPTGP